MATLFYNAQILTMTQETPSLLHGAVGVVGSEITFVSDSQSDAELFMEHHPQTLKVDCQGRLLMPGLINTHAHTAMTLQRSTGDDVELMEWLNNIVWPFEAQQSSDDIEAGFRLGVAEMLLGGTTTVVDMYWPQALMAPVAESMGIRALLGENIFEGSLEQLDELFSSIVRSTSHCKRVSGAVAPHAPYTCSPETLKNCVAIAEKYNLPMMVHLAETLDEEKTVRELYDKTPTEHLDSCGVIKPSTILAHGVHLSDSDIELINSRGASIAHNPQCNMKISSGVAPVPKLLSRGVNVALGTDGVCSNNDLDMWDEMRTASFLHKLIAHSPTVLPAYQVLKMATVNGAKAIGLEGKLGIIAPGALADIIVVNTSRVHYRPSHNLISSLVYCGKAADVQYVMVDGEMLVDNYSLVGCDLESLCCDVEQRSRRIFASMKRS